MSTSKRKWAPKGKGGCSTCKTRHVRCDKMQPRCTPCQKSFRQCGYSSIPESDPLKIIVWQPTNLVVHHISQNSSHTSAEIRAFDFFRAKVAITLGGFFDSSFWSRDILQVAQQEDPVRHAVVALASLSETMLETTPGGLGRPPEPFTIGQHTKAISDLSQKIQEGNNSSVEVVLITCLLLVCFEMFQNNYESALSHMSSGVYVFYNWVSKHPRSTRDSKELTIQLELIFGRVMLQTILFIDTKPMEWKFVKSAFTPAFPSIPPVFRSVGDARNCLDRCMCSLYHKMLASQFRDLEVPEMISGPQLDTNPLNEWSLSFKYFLAEQNDKLSGREQNVAILLEIQHITATILAYAGPFNQETIFDSFEEAFFQIIVLASHLVITNPSKDSPQEDQSPFPSFDMGILPHLYFVTSRCRHPSLRRQALHLLRRGPIQEGIWHSRMLANIGERIMSIEERDCESAQSSADIPASARLSVINATINSVQRTVTLHCCRQDRGEQEIREVIHELVEY